MLLQDRHNLVPYEKLPELSQRIEQGLLIMCQKVEGGGNPFLYAMISGLPHHLAKLDTCDTNGNEVYWNPAYIEQLTPQQISVELMHMALHLALAHTMLFTDPPTKDLNHVVFQLAMDAVADSVLDATFKSGGYNGNVWSHVQTVTLKDIEDHLQKNTPLPDRFTILDPAVNASTLHQVYDRLMLAFKNSGNTGQQMTRHGHMPSQKQMNKATLKAKIIAAQMTAKNMTKGHSPKTGMPPQLETMLAELEEPQLSLKDHVRNVFYRRSNAGLKKDWSRFRRRHLAQGNYIPKTKSEATSRFLYFMDVSGSMSDEALRVITSQVQSVVPFGSTECEGLVIPGDETVYWDKSTTVHSLTDLKRVKVLGRGGTVFDEFFEQYPTKVGKDFGVIIIGTDGYFEPIPAHLAPKGCEVVWVLAEPNSSFKPSFGRKVERFHLYGSGNNSVYQWRWDEPETSRAYGNSDSDDN